MPKSDATFDAGDYAPVAERIALFYARFPTGRIVTDLISDGGGRVVFRASVYRSSGETAPAATGWAAEREDDGEVNAVACLENAETSAVGRALANLGFTASARRPSREEMQKAERARARLAGAAGGVAGRAMRRAPEQSGEPAAQTALPQIGMRGSAAPEHRPFVVREPTQARTHALADVLDLLARAELRGLEPPRAERLRARLARDGHTLRQLHRLERRLRTWLEDRDECARGAGLPPTPSSPAGAEPGR